MMKQTLVEIILLSTLLNITLAYSQTQIGVEAGHWVRYDYTITGGAQSPVGKPEWAKIEFLSIQDPTVTVRVTMHMTTGSEYNDTTNWNINSGTSGIGTFLGFIIPANRKTGDSVYMLGYGNTTITGEDTRTYAGAKRDVVYTSFYQALNDYQYTYYWDKETGIMVEATAASSSVTATVKATSTNIWQSLFLGLPIEPVVFYSLVLAAIVAVIIVTAFLILRRKKPLETQSTAQ